MGIQRIGFTYSQYQNLRKIKQNSMQFDYFVFLNLLTNLSLQ